MYYLFSIKIYVLGGRRELLGDDRVGGGRGVVVSGLQERTFCKNGRKTFVGEDESCGRADEESKVI